MGSTEYFFLTQNLFENLEMIEIVGASPATAEFEWTAGVAFDREVPKDTLMLDPAYGTNFPDFFDTTIPVMSQRLIDAIAAAGVDNLVAYPMTLQRKDTQAQFEGYRAVNIVGCVDAVDASQSPHRTRFGKPHFEGKIVIDPNVAGDRQAFRLTYGPALIVVTRTVADALRIGDFAGVMLQPTEDYAGV
jgi:hypothetical protein